MVLRAKEGGECDTLVDPLLSTNNNHDPRLQYDIQYVGMVTYTRKEEVKEVGEEDCAGGTVVILFFVEEF